MAMPGISEGYSRKCRYRVAMRKLGVYQTSYGQDDRTTKTPTIRSPGTGIPKSSSNVNTAPSANFNCTSCGSIACSLGLICCSAVATSGCEFIDSIGYSVDIHRGLHSNTRPEWPATRQSRQEHRIYVVLYGRRKDYLYLVS